MPIRKLACFDLEAIVPVAASNALEHIASNREGSRLPLFEHVAVLVQHERRILEEICGTAAQINAPSTCGCNGSAMQSHEQRVLDHAHLVDRLTKQDLERGTDRIRHRDGTSYSHDASMILGRMMYTIGHSNHPIERFIALLQQHGVDAVGDVRSTPYSRFNPQFRKEKLQAALADAGIRYVFLGEELGARTQDPSCYDAGGRVSYAKLAATDLFRRGIDRLLTGMQTHRIAIMCAEREPLDCHRTILVSRELERAGVPVTHILSDGTLESHHHAMERLAGTLKLADADLFRSPDELIEEAYEKQGARISYVRND
jgi:hypothetical protein